MRYSGHAPGYNAYLAPHSISEECAKNQVVIFARALTEAAFGSGMAIGALGAAQAIHEGRRYPPDCRTIPGRKPIETPVVPRLTPTHPPIQPPPHPADCDEIWRICRKNGHLWITCVIAYTGCLLGG
jgi:hypothetical protein